MINSTGKRTRTITWNSPDTSVEATTSLDPVAYLIAMREGGVPKPPLYELLRIDVIDAEVGRVKLAITPDESFVSPLGYVGGGVIMTALDTTLAWACQTRAPLGRPCTTIEMKTNFFRPVDSMAPRLLITGESIFDGSRVIVAQAKIMDSHGHSCAVATATCLVLGGK